MKTIHERILAASIVFIGVLTVAWVGGYEFKGYGMKTIHKRILAASIVFIWVLTVAWVGGYEFDERGSTAVYIYLGASAVTAAAAFYPFD